MNIRMLTKEDVVSMADLLSQRHKRERTVFDGLNPIFEDNRTVLPLVEKLFDQKIVIGVGAFEGDQLLAYIMSHVLKDDNFGRCAWVKYEGMAAQSHVKASLYRELYAYIADLWLQAGCLKHYAIVPAGELSVVNAWLHCGFAYEQVFGMMKIDAQEIDPSSDILVRKARPEDGEVLSSLSGIILNYQAKSPTFAAALPELFSDLKKGYAGLASDDGANVLLAYQNQELLGFTCGYFDGDDDSNMMMPYKGMELGVASTIPSNQKKGVGTLLTKHLLNDALEAGYVYTMTDWRITNLRSSVFWPKMGYQPYAYRMIRNIDPRAYWANGEFKL